MNTTTELSTMTNSKLASLLERREKQTTVACDAVYALLNDYETPSQARVRIGTHEAFENWDQEVSLLNAVVYECHRRLGPNTLRGHFAYLLKGMRS